MTIATDPFNIQFGTGENGATEENSQHAYVWDGPVLVAVLMRIGDEWIADDLDTDYAGNHEFTDSWETVGEFIQFLNNEVNS